MTPIDADYFDGKSARRVAAAISVAADRVVVTHGGICAEFERNAVRVHPQIKGTPRRIEFPDGSAAVVHDHAAVEAAFGIGAVATLAHRLESHLGFVLAALAGVAVTLALGYFYGLPWAAREIALRLPASIESQIAEAATQSLDRAIFKPSALDEDLRKETAKAFAELRAASDLSVAVRLEFRDGNWIGANALALPGGVVVVTDQLVNAMPGVNETAAVLAHELGHVQHRHSLRHLLQDSIAALAATAIYGDITAFTGIAATAPTVLAHNGYSRDFEREADVYAFALLAKTGRSPTHFATAMRALEKSHLGGQAGRTWRKRFGLPDADPPRGNPPDSTGDRPGKREFGYLSTHPATEDRIRAAEAAATAP